MLRESCTIVAPLVDTAYETFFTSYRNGADSRRNALCGCPGVHARVVDKAEPNGAGTTENFWHYRHVAWFPDLFYCPENPIFFLTPLP